MQSVSLIRWFRRTEIVTSIGLFYKKVDFTWRVSDCEELGGRLTGNGVGLGAKSSDSTELY